MTALSQSQRAVQAPSINAQLQGDCVLCTMHLLLTEVCGRDEQCNHIRPVESRREAPSILGQIFVPIDYTSSCHQPQQLCLFSTGEQGDERLGGRRLYPATKFDVSQSSVPRELLVDIHVVC